MNYNTKIGVVSVTYICQFQILMNCIARKWVLGVMSVDYNCQLWISMNCNALKEYCSVVSVNYANLGF